MAQNENLPARRQRDTWMMPSRGTEIWNPETFLISSPWQAMRRMQDEMERMFEGFLPGAGAMSPAQGSRTLQQIWNPSVDVSEDGNEYRLEVDLPGVPKDNISVDVSGGQITIRAEMREETGPTDGQQEKQSQQERQYHRRERRYGMFSRTFPLPDDVMEDKIRCEFRDGVLSCHLPKSERQAQTRRIPVSDGAQSQIPPANSGEFASGKTQADRGKRKAA